MSTKLPVIGTVHCGQQTFDSSSSNFIFCSPIYYRSRQKSLTNTTTKDVVNVFGKPAVVPRTNSPLSKLCLAALETPAFKQFCFAFGATMRLNIDRPICLNCILQVSKIVKA